MRQINFTHGEYGFSLLENVTGLTVMGIGLTALIGLYSKISEGSIEAAIVMDKTVIAESQMERLISDYYNPRRGYAYVCNADHYPTVQTGQYTVRTVIDTTHHERNGVSYALVTVSARHATLGEDTELKMWFTKP
jgi:Tfp pilus assembly protein PilV